jgi:hypothetical protein
MKIKSANPAPIRNTACETPGTPGNLKTKTQKRDACCVRNFFTGGLLRAAQILVVNTTCTPSPVGVMRGIHTYSVAAPSFGRVMRTLS